MNAAHLRRNLYATEEQLRPDPAYLEKHGAAVQPALFIDASMRAIAVSWLVEVACEYGLHQETLFLAIALLDRFLTHSKARGPSRMCTAATHMLDALAGAIELASAANVFISYSNIDGQ